MLSVFQEECGMKNKERRGSTVWPLRLFTNHYRTYNVTNQRKLVRQLK